MLQKDELNRAKIDEILSSKWLTQTSFSANQIEANIESRLWLLEDEKAKKCVQNKKDKKRTTEKKMS